MTDSITTVETTAAILADAGRRVYLIDTTTETIERGLRLAAIKTLRCWPRKSGYARIKS